MHRHFSLAVAFLMTGVIAAASIACDSGSDADRSEARITVESGGELRSSNGSFVLTVPPGAVAEDVTISFEESSGGPVGDVPDVDGPGFELKPDGLQFLVPATVSLTVPFDDLEIDAETGETVAFDLLTVSSDGEVSGLGNVANTFDVTAGELVLSGEVSHFSWMVRTKLKLRVSLEQVEPRLRIVGNQFIARANISEFGSPLGYGVNWKAEALGQLRLDEASAFYDPRQTSGVYGREEVVRGIDGAVRPAATRAINESQIGFLLNLTCTGSGPGSYSLNVDADPTGPDPNSVPRKLRIAMQGAVVCADSPEARATATSIAYATAVADAANPVYTPVFTAVSNCEAGPPYCTDGTPTTVTPTTAPPTATPVPSPVAATPTPQVSRTSEKLRLIVIASTGDVAPGTGGQRFTAFELPSTGGDSTYFHGFMDNGQSGVWWFEEDDLIGNVLASVVVGKSPSVPGDVVSITSGPLSVSQTGLVALTARFKQEYDPLTNLEFVEFVGIYSGKQGSNISLVYQGENAPGRPAETVFSQFYSAQVSDSSLVVYQAFADKKGFWLADGLGSSLVVIEGQAIAPLIEGWRESGSGRMQSAGVTPDGKMLFFLPDGFIVGDGGTEAKGNGLWLISSDGRSDLIAASSMKLPDGGSVDEVFDPSMNRSGKVAFRARSSYGSGSSAETRSAIWKTDGNGGLTKVAEPGFRIGGLEVVDLASPLALDDGRVAFVGSAFDSTNSLIYLVLVESANGFDVLARTDALPGASGGTTSAVPFATRQLSVNSRGHIAFEVGFGDSVWMQSPGGHIHRVIGIGDTVSVPGANGPTTKTVSFVQYTGGANTGTGLPTGFSDTGKLSVLVTFSDGTKSLVMATFDDAPITQ